MSAILTHAATYHRDTEIVSRTVGGAIHRYTYAEAEQRSKRLARALLRLGIKSGDRVGTLAWNTYRHFELFETEGVTLSLGVPTIWLGFAERLAATGARCTTLRSALSGGAAVPPVLIEAFEYRGIAIVQGWGMAEMSPLGTVSALKAKHLALDVIGQRAIKAKAGRPVFGVETKIVDESGRTLPHDGASVGEVMVRGPWIISGYFEDEEATPMPR